MAQWSEYQLARLLIEGFHDYYNRNGSWGNPWTRTPGDLNYFRGEGGGQSNVHQGRNRHSINFGELMEAGHNNLVQHGGLNVGRGGGKSFFNWQGNKGYNAINFSQGEARDYTSWQRGRFNVTDASKSKKSEIWQGGYANGTVNLAKGGTKGNHITQVGGKNAINMADANGGRSTIEQVGRDGTTNVANGSDRKDNITQTSQNGYQFVDAGDGNDRITVNGNNNQGSLDGGDGNDKFFVNGRGNSYNIDGGDGNNSAYFGGRADDYDITRNEDGTWTVADRNNPDAVSTLRNIDNLYFKGDDGQFERYRQPDGDGGAQTVPLMDYVYNGGQDEGFGFVGQYLFGII